MEPFTIDYRDHKLRASWLGGNSGAQKNNRSLRRHCRDFGGQDIAHGAQGFEGVYPRPFDPTAFAIGNA